MRARTTSTRSSSGARRPASPPSATDGRPVRVAPNGAPIRIERIGADGDGVAGAHYLPFTLPGELVAPASGAVLEPSPERVSPPCPHFGSCGGCALQHWEDGAYAAWKIGLLRDALIRAGTPDPPVAPLIRTPPHARRRIDLALRRTPARIEIGLHPRRSHAVVDFTTCVVLHPGLLALLPPLRQTLLGLAALRRQGSAILNLLDTGPDLLLRLDAVPTAADRTRLAAFAAAHRIPRIAIATGNAPPETAAQLSPATLAFSGTEISPPPGAFLQASTEGERAIIDAVLAGLPDRLPKKSRLIELYAGCGTLTFALATRARVLAVEGDAAAHAALRRATLGGRIETLHRDLARQPFSPAELKNTPAIILDPPHAGAAAQMPAIAAAAVPIVIYVSCNPAALARDSTTLRNAGYRLERTTPIDQFLWSPRLESVSVFRSGESKQARVLS